jgi:hypothetical protein
MNQVEVCAALIHAETLKDETRRIEKKLNPVDTALVEKLHSPPVEINALCPTLKPNQRSRQQNRIQSAVAAVATITPSHPIAVYLSRDVFIFVVREMVRREKSERLRQASDEALLHLYSIGWVNLVSLTHGGAPLRLFYLRGLPDGCIVPMFGAR